jgi:hypothetical protein
MQKALRIDFEFDSGDKNGYGTYIWLFPILILLYFSVLYSRHTTKTTHACNPLENPKKKISLGFSPEIQIYTCVPQKQYRVIGIQLLQVTGRPLLHHLGIGNVHFSLLLRPCFLFNTVSRPRPPIV